MTTRSEDTVPSGPRAALELVGLVVAPATLLTGLLYFFGWVRTSTAFGYFGVDLSILDFTPQDYILRSIGVAFRPVAIVLVVLSCLLGLRVLLRALRSTRPHSKAVRYSRAALLASTVTLLGLALGGIGGWTLFRPMTSATMLGIGALLADILVQTWAPIDRHGGESSQAERAARPPYARIIAISAALLALFWGTAIYAQDSGANIAIGVAANPSSQPGVLVYSKQRLQIAGPGVRTERLDSNDAAYAYKCTGLRLLIRTRGYWLLLPEGWARRNETAVIRLPDDSSIRVDLLPPRIAALGAELAPS